MLCMLLLTWSVYSFFSFSKWMLKDSRLMRFRGLCRWPFVVIVRYLHSLDFVYAMQLLLNHRVSNILVEIKSDDDRFPPSS